MAAPAIIALLAFLGGSGTAAGLTGGFATAGVAIADVDGIVVDAGKVCAATDPLIDALGDLYPKAKLLSELAGAADNICGAIKAGPGVATDAKMIGLALNAIAAARAKLGAGPAGAAVGDRGHKAALSAPTAALKSAPAMHGRILQ